MKFLQKNATSAILTQGMKYKATGDNSILREALLREQKNFCAYTEIFIEETDAVEIEHFNPDLKGSDDYYNYYTTLRSANLHNKKEYPGFKGAKFFQTLFFQKKDDFAKRVNYKDGQYIETDPTDAEALGLIAFLGFNRMQLFKQRQGHIKRLKETFRDANYSQDQQLQHFRTHKQDLDFITAIEIELGLDLSEFYN